MRRSEINNIIKGKTKFLMKQNFYIPKFAFWKLGDWKNKRNEIEEDEDPLYLLVSDYEKFLNK